MGRQNALQTLHNRRKRNPRSLGSMHILQEIQRKPRLDNTRTQIDILEKNNSYSKRLENKDMFDNILGVIELESHINDTTRSETYPSGQVHAPPILDRETCPRGCQGPRTYAGVAISTRDMSVGEVILDHPP